MIAVLRGPRAAERSPGAGAAATTKRSAVAPVAADAGASEGSRLLAVARGSGVDRTPLKVIAGQLACSEQFVGQLMSGRSLPSLQLAATIFRVFRIHAHLWCEPSKVALSKDIAGFVGFGVGKLQDVAMPTNPEVCKEVEEANRRGASVKLPSSEPTPARDRSTPAVPHHASDFPVPDLPEVKQEKNSRWPR